ncbi:hypothetical protein COJ46_07710 [Bacillus sp. AFS077874]|uniref:hypothetical protein n=1 Tax=unclassified Bacillus (in: firmicutes) TaxID=185979 RepID=UPI000BEE78FA|nr:MULTISPECIES: hypothetical protein [unclassified Bacillus (in: firmicutes)]PEC50522.1 hypothetical protein CON00_06200 [Bacillus sp. AFS096315]PFM81945.1 hypothetical protein COJ46_07710 [Bacillus sp. AFS077874]
MRIKNFLNNLSSDSIDQTYLFISDSLYINLEISLVSLIYYFYFKAKPMIFLEYKTSSKIINFLIPRVRILRVAQLTVKYLINKYHYNKNKDSFKTITTKFNGHSLLVTRLEEYKIINFKTKVVTTVFPEIMSKNEIEKNILNKVDAQNCSLAPKVLNWDINSRYIRESYINFKPINIEYKNFNSFKVDVIPLITEIISSANTNMINLSQYSQKLINLIEGLIEKHSIDTADFKKENAIIIEFFGVIKNKLKIYSSNIDILRVFSHGDFWEGNILKNKSKSYVIDWNTHDMRSCYFDFYDILFEIAFKIFNSKNKMITCEMEEAVKYFQNYLMVNMNSDSKLKVDTLNHSDIYRFLFYLEVTLLKLKEYPENNHLAQLGKFIGFFKLYESALEKDSPIYIEDNNYSSLCET